MKNTEAFLTLLKRYQSITSEEIEAVPGVYFNGQDIMVDLTGFSQPTRCLLCKATVDLSGDTVYDCNFCVWQTKDSDFFWSHMCLNDNYYLIKRAQNTTELLAALAERVQLMTNELKVLGIDVD